MAKDHIQEAYYDEETGISKVTLETKWGTFSAYAKVNEEDADIANRWDGCDVAYYKCIMQKYKAKGRAFRERANGMDHAANVLNEAVWDENRATWNYTSDSVLLIRCLAEVAEKESRKNYNIARQMEKDFDNYVSLILRERRAARTKV